MNHRELILSANKKAKFGFLQLPEELQNEVMQGLDGQTLTIEEARDLIRSRGYSLGHDAVSGYYRAVRRERRLHDATQELKRVFEQFQDQSMEDNLKALTNFLVAQAVRQVADGEVGFREIDLAKIVSGMARMARQAPSVKDGPASAYRDNSAEPPGDRRPIDAQTLKELRSQLGL